MSYQRILALSALPQQISNHGLSRWPARALALTVLLSLVLMAAQTLSDRGELDRVMASRVSNGSKLVESAIAERFDAMRRTLGQMDGLAEQFEAGAPADAAVRLRYLRDGLAPLLPGCELAIYSPDGQPLAETSPFVRNGVPGLVASLAAPEPRYGTALAQTDRGVAVVVQKPHWTRRATVGATLVLVAPDTAVRAMVSRLVLMPASQIMLLDARQRVLAAFTQAGGARVGASFPVNGRALAGNGEVQFIDSPHDGLTRLSAVRRIALPWSDGADYWSLQYGHATSDYRAAWRISTCYNLAISVLLLVLWYYSAHIEAQKRKVLGQAMTSLRLLRQALDTMPSPVALIDRAEATISIGNAMLVDRFGAVAGQGAPVVRLFKNAADWGALQQAGKIEALPMLGREGRFLALAHCTALKLEQEDGAGYWLLTLVDVTTEQERLAHQRDAALRDGLTGLANLAGFVERATLAAAEANLHQRPLAVLVLHIDHFRQITDSHGQGGGERALAGAAEALRTVLREDDVAARLGGRDFAVLLADTPAAPAIEMAERIRAAVAARAVALADGQLLATTVSIGLAAYQTGETDPQAALARARQALQRAKDRGRNRCEID